MKFFKTSLFFFVAIVFISCGSDSDGLSSDESGSGGDASADDGSADSGSADGGSGGGASDTGEEWARTVTAGDWTSRFYSVSVDTSGNTYTAGIISEGDYNFGSGTVVGIASEENSIIVKYSSAGTVQWAKAMTAGGDEAYFHSVSVDSSDNIYAVGHIAGTSDYNFGSGTVAGTSSYGNAVIVKYNSAGTAQWAKTITAGDNGSQFYSASVDTSGNIYAAGYIYGTENYNFGSGTVAGTSSYCNAVVVKYNSAGTAQWAKTVTAGDEETRFYSVSVDASGNIYAAGHIYGTGNHNFGSGTIAGTASSYNAIIVKYNSAGTAQWAKTVTAGDRGSGLYAVSVDASGNIYTAGYIYGTGNYNFGGGAIAGTDGNNNAVVVKYNSAGTAQWARTVTAGDESSVFHAVSVDTSGNAYAVGYIDEAGSYNFGSGAVAGTADDANAVIVKYDSAGTAQWAKTVTAGDESSVFHAVSVDVSGNIYVAGYIHGTGDYNFGSGAIVGTASSSNAVIVKYVTE